MDHSLCVSKFLWLYYKNAHIMSIDHLEAFLTDVYRTKFYKLFFHWSYQVRNVFYHLTLFIIDYRIRNDTNISDTVYIYLYSVNHKFWEGLKKKWTLLIRLEI